MREFACRGHAIELPNDIDDINELWSLLEDNRLCNILCDDNRLLERQAEYRRSVWSNNAPAISTIYLLAALFEKHRVSHLFIKGPLMLGAIYDNYFFRHSTDVDVIVAPTNFSRASALLSEAGFNLDPHCRSAYWRWFLGEQHYAPPNAELTLVDVHKFVRHPSGYAMAMALAENAAKAHHTRDIGDKHVAVPNPVHAALLLIAYAVKGLMKSEAVGCFIVDLAIVIKRMDEAEILELIAAAEDKRLRSALYLSLRSVRMIVSLPPLLESKMSDLKQGIMSDQVLFQQFIRPVKLSTRQRIKLLVETCDRGRDAITCLAWEVGRKIAQQALHRRA